jgi:adenine phosphoribosyltransferase
VRDAVVGEKLAAALDRITAVPDYPTPGIRFWDITPLLADASALRTVVDAMAAQLPPVDLVAGIEARGFVFAAAIAGKLGTGLVTLRKPGKLPVVADEVSYQLEYGSAALQLPANTVRAGQRVAVVDDVLATGGTLAAGCELVERAGAEVAAVSVLVELSALPGRARLAGRTVQSLGSL